MVGRRLGWSACPGALVLLAPTTLALALDLAMRAGPLSRERPLGTYVASVLLSAALWALPLSLAARLFRASSRRRRRLAARVALAALLGAWLFPLCVFAYGGQALYYHVFHTYMARDSVRFGVALHATLAEWFVSGGGARGLVLVVALGAVIAAVLAAACRRHAACVARARWAPTIAFALAALCLWFDGVETRAAQAALPDVCFVHGVVHALRDGGSGKGGWARPSVRTPAPLPVWVSEHRPNVLLVITESVRADAICSLPPPRCRARFLDGVASDRVPLGKLTTQSPGTVTACVILWTGLAPTADFATVHAAPTIWELARAVGYRTAYISAQNLKDADFGAYVSHAGIDVRVSGTDLGSVYSSFAGALDERATERTLSFARAVPAGTPWLAVMHLSNTHSPYRVAPELQPFEPHQSLPFGGMRAYQNHYRNAVVLQERTLASFLGELRAMPSFEDTVVLFVSDHGEQFGEHGGLYHLHTLFDEEVRIPGFVVAGPRALSPEQRAALSSIGARRTYSADVNATIVDLLGVWDARGALPFGNRTRGRSLLRPLGPDEPVAILSIASAVWESDVVARGAMRGEQLLFETAGGRRSCYDMASDPEQQRPLPEEACGALGGELTRAFR